MNKTSMFTYSSSSVRLAILFGVSQWKNFEFRVSEDVRMLSYCKLIHTW